MTLSYQSAHVQVWRVRGQACEQICACGKPAAHWAYDHDDPHEKKDRAGQVYSADPEHYLAMCHSCHRRFDLEHPPVCRPLDPVGWLTAGLSAYPIWTAGQLEAVNAWRRGGDHGRRSVTLPT